MGKKSSNQQTEKKAQRIEAKNKSIQKSKTIKTAVICVVIVLAIVAAVFGTAFGIRSYQDSGAFLRNKTVMKTDHYKIDAAMLSYVFYSQIDELSSSNFFSLSKSLKEQYYASSTMSYFDYIMNYYVLYSVRQNLILAEWGKSNNVITDDEEAINQEIADLRASAEAKGLSLDQYLSDYYGRGVKESDVRKMIALQIYANQAQEAFAAAHKPSDEAIENYYNENRDEFIYAEYISYTFSSEDSEARANEAAKCKTPEELKAYVQAYLIETGKTEEEAKEAAENLIESSIPKNSTRDISEFLFADERQVGDTTVLKNTSSGSDQYTVYQVLKTAFRKEYTTKSIRYMLFEFDNYESEDDTLTEANRIYDLYKEGDMTEDAFTKLVKEYSEDSNSKSTGGFYENMEKDAAFTEIEDWVYDAERKSGDTNLIKTENGYYLVYFVGDGMIAWKSSASTTLLNKDYMELYEQYQFDVNSDAVYSVPGNTRIPK